MTRGVSGPQFAGGDSAATGSSWNLDPSARASPEGVKQVDSCVRGSPYGALMAQDLGQLINAIIVDAYGLDEQLMGFLQVFLDEVTLPAPGVVLGSAVVVVGFDFEGDERRGLVAGCRNREGTGRSHWSTFASSRTRSPGCSTPPSVPGSGFGRFQPANHFTGPGLRHEQASAIARPRR